MAWRNRQRAGVYSPLQVRVYRDVWKRSCQPTELTKPHRPDPGSARRKLDGATSVVFVVFGVERHRRVGHCAQPARHKLAGLLRTSYGTARHKLGTLPGISWGRGFLSCWLCLFRAKFGCFLTTRCDLDRWDFTTYEVMSWTFVRRNSRRDGALLADGPSAFAQGDRQPGRVISIRGRAKTRFARRDEACPSRLRHGAAGGGRAYENARSAAGVFVLAKKSVSLCVCVLRRQHRANREPTGRRWQVPECWARSW